MKNYDLVITTNCPSFYKINMYNEINKEIKIFVIFLGFSDDVIIDVDFDTNCIFDYKIINRNKLCERNIVKTYFKVKNLLDNMNFKKIIYGGYTYPEFLLVSYLTPKNKNILETESAGETVITGWKYYLKRTLLKRYSKVIASGQVHAKMIRKMGFNGPIVISKGVGVMAKLNKVTFTRSSPGNNPLKFLYVGRLIDIKNVEFVLDVFNKNGLPLTIVGDGLLKKSLEDKACENIKLLGFQSNETLGKIYTSHDVFILPSIKEPWGLVVEEALYWGCTLLLSDRIGSSNELLTEPNTGLIFDPTSPRSLQDTIDKMIENFSFYKTNVDSFDIDKKDKEQIQAHVDLIND